MIGPWENIRFIVFDVDDVVIDTDRAGAAAERSVIAPLTPRIGAEAAARVQVRFSKGYDILRTQLRQPAGVKTEEFARFEQRIIGWQRGVLGAGYELKLWSRDTLLAIALEDEGFAVTRDLITPATDHYWNVLAETTLIHEDAAAILRVLRGRGVAVHLATNSDGFLAFDEAAMTFVYDPPNAVERKIRRLGKLAEIALGPIDVSVGDPVGKPKPDFYRKVLAEFGAKLGTEIDPRDVIGVGDSLTNDVMPLISLGARAGGWLVRKKLGEPPAPLDEHAGVAVIGALTDLEALLR